jgi:hypothetical protein
MISSLHGSSFLIQDVKVMKKFSNEEIKFYLFFYSETYIFPEFIIHRAPFLFFFVKNEEYFEAKRHLKNIRSKIHHKKVMIIRNETNLLRLLFSFFPDTYIHDIILGVKANNRKEVKILFLFYEDRGIAIGKNGCYINIINEIFNKFIMVEGYDLPINIKCDSIDFKK